MLRSSQRVVAAGIAAGMLFILPRAFAQDSGESPPSETPPDGGVTSTGSRILQAAEFIGNPNPAQGSVPAAPTYDQLRDADVRIQKLEEAAKAFEFHGYFRAGYGMNSVGGQ